MFEKIRKTINTSDAFIQHLGITVDEIRHGYARASMPEAPHLCNGLGNLHGGASFTLADIAFAAVALSSGLVTVNIASSVNYVNAGKIGPYTAEAKIVSESRKLCTVEVLVTDGQGTPITVVMATGYRNDKRLVDEPAD